MEITDSMKGLQAERRSRLRSTLFWWSRRLIPIRNKAGIPIPTLLPAFDSAVGDLSALKSRTFFTFLCHDDLPRFMSGGRRMRGARSISLTNYLNQFLESLVVAAGFPKICKSAHQLDIVRLIGP